MVTHRILLFGGSGQVGKALQNQPTPSHWLWSAPPHATCDLMQPGDIAKAIHDFSPDLVINSAAMAHVDDCEQNPDKALAINFHAVANMAAQCTTVDAPLIQLSTDYVFDGNDGPRAYGPDDAMNPINVYGETKMLGEEAVRHGISWHVIARTSLVFSAYGKNTLTRTLGQIESQNEVKAATDVTANPTSADALAQALIAVAAAILNGKGNGFGTFHIAGKPAVTRYEFLQAVMEAYAPFTERRPLIVPITSHDMIGKAPRPLYSVLNTDKIRDVYGITPCNWRDDLSVAVKKYVEKRK